MGRGDRSPVQVPGMRTCWQSLWEGVCVWHSRWTVGEVWLKDRGCGKVWLAQASL